MSNICILKENMPIKFLNIIYILLLIFFTYLIFSFYKSNNLFANEILHDDKVSEEIRIINITVFYDNINHKDVLISNLKNRFKEINNFYIKNFNIKWKILDLKYFNFNSDLINLSDIFTLYRDSLEKISLNSNSEVILGIITRPIRGKGIASTFSNFALISSSDILKNSESSLVISHEFAHLFGAWHTRTKGDFMQINNYSKNPIVSNTKKQLMILMKNYNFNSNLVLEDKNLLKKISRLYKNNHMIGEIDPVARLYTDNAYKYYSNKKFTEALINLKKSNEIHKRWHINTLLLAKTYFELGLYDDSFVAYSRAIFYGSRVDIIFENKLNQKFIDLQKNDSTINNPFIINN